MKDLVLLIIYSVAAHALFDFSIQGQFVVDAKRKDSAYWITEKDNCYYMLLLGHGIQWGCGIIFPYIVFAFANRFYINRWCIKALLINIIIHIIIDHLKVNLKLITFKTDQIIHLIQIILTAINFYIIFL
jgi:hypothetical protein